MRSVIWLVSILLCSVLNVSPASASRLMSPISKRQKMRFYDQKYFFVFLVFSHINTLRMLMKLLIPPDSCFSAVKWLNLYAKVVSFYKLLSCAFGGGHQASTDLHAPMRELGLVSWNAIVCLRL